MNISERIIAHKKDELLIRKMMVPVDQVISSVHIDRKCISLKYSLAEKNDTGIIPEFKRRSVLNIYKQEGRIEKVISEFVHAGACGISIATDNHFLNGSTDDLLQAREYLVPLIRNDFIVDSYQVITTKAIGADVIFLMASLLSVQQAHAFSRQAKQLGLEVMLQVHSGSHLGHISENTDMVVVNRRNLKTFEPDLDNFKSLVRLLPKDIVRIARGAIENTESIVELREHGYNGYMIGEAFMKETDCGKAFANFVKKLN